MRLSLTLVDGRTGRPVDALVDFDTDQPVGDLVPALVRLLGEQVHDTFARRVPVWVDGAEVDLRASAGQAGVHSGAVLSLFEPADLVARQAPAGVAELRVASGPGAGRIHRLPLGETVVGNGATGWSLPDLRLPAKALTVDVAIDGTVRVVPSDGLGARLDDEDLENEGAEWPVGGHVAAGGTVLVRGEVVTPVADVEARPEEALIDFNRQPRMLPPDRERAFHLPDKPAEIRKRPVPWVMVVVPVLVAMPMAYFFGPRMLMFALLSPVMILANFASDRKRGRKEAVEKQQKYDETHASVTARVAAGLVAEQAERRMSCPDPAELLINAIGPGPRLWERRHNDPDYLRVRVGLAQLPAGIKVEERRDKTEEEAPPRMLELVPAWLDLAQLGVVGVAGDLETAPPIAHWIVAQAALLHSPRDVRVTVLSDAEGEDDWSWVRWLPHARIGGDAEALALGTQQDSVGRRLAELTAMIPQREAALRDKVRPSPDVLVVLDGARRLRTLPAVVDLLRRGPAVGIMLLCIEEEVRQLPEECRAVVACAAGEVRIQESASDGTDGIVPDLVEVPWCETVARAISPLRDTTPEEEATGLPGSARLLEDIALDPPTPEAIAPRWANGRTTDVVVGAGYDGPFRLDLRRDGPHALIAGTTGSGKSEFLQTLVASLSVANRPDELTFVLVDYKGGSAFKDCARLPHTVGMVTDLDNHLVGRALVSLGAELRRREHLLAAPGAKDLEDYWALQRSQPDLPAIPRLVLVIDEFASMVAELPDFVNGLVSIAQRGRSLGIHLVLATQRPSGVVSADIRANTNLRISLRVTDENDSRDVIDAPDAARIQKNQPGRAFVRSGASTLMPFQSGRVGGRSPDAEAGPKKADEPLAWAVPWAEVGLPAPARPKSESVQTDEADTDLSAVVDAIASLNASLGIPAQHRPWLDALPDLVEIDDLPALPADDGPERLAAAWALEDLPALQEQRPKTFELGRDGHLYVIGGPRSGRSTAMRTLAGALADQVGVRDLHVYGLDCGNGSLLGLSNLPHTGAVVSRTQVDRASRLLSRLVSVVEERQAQL
ncbi:MAG: FtsK/SpoIIIE domain-containing protein, partial [Nocardioides sp.]